MRNWANYREKLEEGFEFEDFVLEQLWDLGWGTIAFRTRTAQVMRGENLGGFEIKRDGKFRETGNLFVETEERSTSESAWHAAGIDSPHKPRHLVIGDERRFWVLAVNVLQAIRDEGKCAHVRTDTACGFLLPTTRADRFCCLKWTPVESEE